MIRTGLARRASSVTVRALSITSLGCTSASNPLVGSAGSTGPQASSTYSPRVSRTTGSPSADDRKWYPGSSESTEDTSAPKSLLGLPSRPMVLKVMSYDSTSRSTDTVDRTVKPAPDAVTVAAKWPSSPPTRVSAVTSTEAVPRPGR